MTLDSWGLPDTQRKEPETMRPAMILSADTNFLFDWLTVTDFIGSVMPYFPVAIAGTVVWLLWLYRVI
ncbi:hypothetical protein [Cryobacterium aureum]|uniref:hypothetical protein n=1 Tax=Cryobacterium aureum TaxID=995037 RepID=UPI000CF3E289|nr:hypothetical protein [Cryobacterium aureum]